MYTLEYGKSNTGVKKTTIAEKIVRISKHCNVRKCMGYAQQRTVLYELISINVCNVYVRGYGKRNVTHVALTSLL